MRARQDEQGFTLIEILIAMVVLMVGLLGILAVFPTAMRSAARAVEDTYCAAISQSVVDAIHMGLRSMHARFDDGTAYFVFDHDGVLNLDQDRKGTMLSSFDLSKEGSLNIIEARDYCVLLPDPSKDGMDAGGRGKAFLYPRQNPQDNKARLTLQKVMGPSGDKPKVQKVYQLGQYFGLEADESQISKDLEKKDPYPQYGFAFTIRPTKAPDPQQPAVAASAAIVPGLFEVVVMVYRNFQPDPRSRFNDPVREFITYVSE
jgi:hypothetical protein